MINNWQWAAPTHRTDGQVMNLENIKFNERGEE